MGILFTNQSVLIQRYCVRNGGMSSSHQHIRFTQTYARHTPFIASATGSHYYYVTSLLIRCDSASPLGTQRQDIRSALPQEETSTSADDADGDLYDSGERWVALKASAMHWQDMGSACQQHSWQGTDWYSPRIAVENRIYHQHGCLMSPHNHKLNQESCDLLQEMDGQHLRTFAPKKRCGICRVEGHDRRACSKNEEK